VDIDGTKNRIGTYCFKFLAGVDLIRACDITLLRTVLVVQMNLTSLIDSISNIIVIDKRQIR